MDDIGRLLINLRTCLTWLEDAHASRTTLVVAVAAEEGASGEGYCLHTFASPTGPEPEGVRAIIAYLHHSFERGEITEVDAGAPFGGTPVRPTTAPRGICLLCGESHTMHEACGRPPA